MLSTINKRTKYELKNASKIMGVNENTIFERALTFYLHAIKDQLALKKEFQDWDALSDQVFIKMGF